MFIEVAEPFGLLYKLNRFLHKTILKTLYTLIIHPMISMIQLYLLYGIAAWHGTYQNDT